MELIKYFIVRKEIIEYENEYNDYLICILAYLQCNRGLNDVVTTSFKILLKFCGYSYGRSEYTKKCINILKYCINILIELGYVYQIRNLDGEIFTSADNFKNDEIMFIDMNPPIANYTSEGFVSVFIPHWEAINDYCMQNNPLLIRKMIKLYCFISQRIFWQSNVRTLAEISNSPYFYRTTLDVLSESLGAGYNQTNISSMLKALDELGVFHIGNVETIKVDSETYSNPGIVIVRDGCNWKEELKAAVNKAMNNRRLFAVNY